MSKQGFEKKIEAVEALRSAAPETSVRELRKALKDRNNYLVSKAAALPAELQLSELIPDLVTAFERFMVDPVKSDPQCWAKNAIAKALKNLGHRDPAVFRRGILHVQLEPVWGGRADSAATLRGTCALALVECPLGDLEILTLLVDALADFEKPVRIDAALAIGQLGSLEGTLPLRLKLLIGDSEPEVMGQCFASLLSLAPGESVEFVGKFLKTHDEDVQLEAVGALAQTRELDAIALIQKFWRGFLPEEKRRAVLMSLAASPLAEAAEFILSVLIEESGSLASAALSALSASRFRKDLRQRIQAAVEGKADRNLSSEFERKLPETE